MESAAENSRSVDRRTPAERAPQRSWISRITLVGALLLLVYFVWSLPEQYARIQLAQAENLFKAEKYDEALASLDSASRYLPKVPGIFIVKAQIYTKMGNKKAAEESLRQALPLLGESPNELMAFVNVGGKLGLKEVVAETCDKIDTVAPKQPLDWHRELLNTSAYGRAVVDRDCEKGLRAIDRALSLPDGMPSLTVAGLERARYEDTRALILHRLGRNEEALVEIDKAIAYIEKTVDADLVKLLPALAAVKSPKPDSDAATEQKTEPQETTVPQEASPEKVAPDPKAADAKAAEPAKKTAREADSAIKEGPYVGMSKKQVLENWAVIFNHRQMIREALGDKAGAELDRQRILELGFTPGDDLH